MIFILFVQLDDDGGGGLGDNEEDYDAFNAETFDAAINGDWENTHENLVLLDQSDDVKEDENDDDDSDLGKLIEHHTRMMQCTKSCSYDFCRN